MQGEKEGWGPRKNGYNLPGELAKELVSCVSILKQQSIYPLHNPQLFPHSCLKKLRLSNLDASLFLPLEKPVGGWS